jgi:hypothetical protein
MNGEQLPDGDEPQHARTMKEQKEWLVAKAKAHARSARARATVPPPPNPQHAANVNIEVPPPLSAESVPESNVEAPPSPGQMPNTTGPTDKPGMSSLEELAHAGGDVNALALLAATGCRTELTAALKELGFRALGTRSKIEKELKALASQH